MTTNELPHICTVTTAIGGRCGQPAVYTFTGSRGEVFGECAKHYLPLRSDRKATGNGLAVGDPVTIQRHGKTYTGTVCRVGARGAVFAQVTYNNGARREVRV